MPVEGEERLTWPDHERRTDDAPDTGNRRRATDTLEQPRSGLDEWRIAFDAHITESREWRARQDQRLTSVENRADLLDGSAGNDGGLIGQLGELNGELKAARDDLRDLKNKTGTKDGQEPPSRSERIFTIVGPILVVLITTLGGIVIAYFAFRGQLAGLQTGGRR